MVGVTDYTTFHVKFKVSTLDRFEDKIIEMLIHRNLNFIVKLSMRTNF